MHVYGESYTYTKKFADNHQIKDVLLKAYDWKRQEKNLYKVKKKCSKVMMIFYTPICILFPDTINLACMYDTEMFLQSEKCWTTSLN